jgi:hypothetical protein
MLLNLQTVKEFLGTPLTVTTDYDALLTKTIAAVESMVARYCGRIARKSDGSLFSSLEFTDNIVEIFDGRRRRESIRLGVYPVKTVVSVEGSIGGDAGTWETVDSTSWVLRGATGELIIPEYFRNIFSQYDFIRVTYSGGFLGEQATKKLTTLNITDISGVVTIPATQPSTNKTFLWRWRDLTNSNDLNVVHSLFTSNNWRLTVKNINATDCEVKWSIGGQVNTMVMLQTDFFKTGEKTVAITHNHSMNTAFLYFDGVEQATVSSVNLVASGNIVFGDGATSIKCQISDVNLLSRFMSASEVAAWSAGTQTIDPTDATVVGQWLLGDGSGTTLTNEVSGGSSGSVSGAFSWNTSGLSGYTVCPPDLLEALKETVRWNWNNGSNFGVKSVASVGGSIVTEKPFPEQCQSIFTSYTKRG